MKTKRVCTACISKQWWRTSWTIQWGHIQNILGLALVILPFINEDNFPGFKPWVYGLALMAAGIITYWLRIKTKKPLGRNKP